MSTKTVHFAENIEEENIEASSDEEFQPLQSHQSPSVEPLPVRSQYALSRQEITRGIANRFVHSRTYIFLYLSMAALSITTIVLSVADGCPGLAFYILEIIINTTMISEVSIRLVAFGKQFWKSPFNVLDLILTLFCAVTLLVLAFAGCGSTSKEEEILDTLLLIARNILQFSRLAAVMRQSGQSIFSRPKPIDLSTARHFDVGLDFDLARENDLEDFAGVDEDDNNINVIFDDEESVGQENPHMQPKPIQNNIDNRDTEDVWASLGQ